MEGSYTANVKKHRTVKMEGWALARDNIVVSKISKHVKVQGIAVFTICNCSLMLKMFLTNLIVLLHSGQGSCPTV